LGSAGRRTAISWPLFPEEAITAFIGIYDANTKTVRFVAPSVDSDSDVEWSPDGKQNCLRAPASRFHATRQRAISSNRIVRIPGPFESPTLRPGMQKKFGTAAKNCRTHSLIWRTIRAGGAIGWAADNRMVFRKRAGTAGSISTVCRADGAGAAKLLTPGNCEVEQWSFAPTAQTILFNSNCDDVDRPPSVERIRSRRCSATIEAGGAGN